MCDPSDFARKVKDENVERLFEVSKSAWGAFVFISFHQTDAFGSFSIMRLGWRHWNFSFFSYKKTQETSIMSSIFTGNKQKNKWNAE